MSRVTLSGLDAKLDAMNSKLDRVVQQYDRHDERIRQLELEQACDRAGIETLKSSAPSVRESRAWDLVNSAFAGVATALAVFLKGAR